LNITGGKKVTTVSSFISSTPVDFLSGWNGSWSYLLYRSSFNNQDDAPSTTVSNKNGTFSLSLSMLAVLFSSFALLGLNTPRMPSTR
jgi:hypothetical protein